MDTGGGSVRMLLCYISSTVLGAAINRKRVQSYKKVGRLPAEKRC